MVTPVSGAKGWLSIQGRLIFCRPGDENQQLDLHEYGSYIIKTTPHAPEEVSLFLDGEKVETEHYGLWLFHPKHYAGLYTLTATAPGQPDQEAWIRVFPHKFTQKAYEHMKDELSRIAVGLLFHLDSPVLERAQYIPRTQETSSLQDYKQIRKIIGELRDIMLRIRLEPHSILYTEPSLQKLQYITRFSPEMVPVPGDKVRIPERKGQNLRPSALPRQWIIRQSHLSYDNDENRLLKYFIQQQLIPKLTAIQQRAEQEKTTVEITYKRYHNQEDKHLSNKLAAVIKECDSMKQRCLYWMSEAFLQGVKASGVTSYASQFLQKDPTYSRFYRLYLQFHQRLQTTIETNAFITTLSLKKVSALYEMWSVFGVTRFIIAILEDAGYQMTANTTFEITENHFHFNVKTNVASIILKKDDIRVEIKYEPYYPNQTRTGAHSAIVATTMTGGPLTPDMAVEVYQGEKPQTALIFDAKYRWKATRSGTFMPHPEAIQAMDNYYNNIRYKQETMPTRRTRGDIPPPFISSAYCIYPGSKLYTQSNDHIGALPFFPNISDRSIHDVQENSKISSTMPI